MPQKTTIISKNVKNTRQIAHIFIDTLLKYKNTKALVVALSGELGAGKTFFTQAVANYLGIKKKVNSPTFVIMKKYSIKHDRYKFLFHLDAYRLKNEKELLHLGWDEILNNKEHLIFIEWPENVIKVIPKNSIFVKISHTKEGHRALKIGKTKVV
jgi:tRNA threonylcarbamoyladenosine biosynthesis protein TsaE